MEAFNHVDSWGLNSLTIRYSYSLPLVPVTLEQLRGTGVFTKLDLRSAYNLVQIREGDERKTAFHTTRGHYEYLVMPYGLTNAPVVFQSFISEIFKDVMDKYVIAYIDGILIYSPTYEDHEASNFFSFCEWVVLCFVRVTKTLETPSLNALNPITGKMGKRTGAKLWLDNYIRASPKLQLLWSVPGLEWSVSIKSGPRKEQ
ncbi:hypothetical protein QTP86_003213 [Hemibagrus guttatus]|nr:hypothetical protein QTP86_003213 [Hemibagrus guttatus]